MLQNGKLWLSYEFWTYIQNNNFREVIFKDHSKLKFKNTLKFNFVKCKITNI